MDAIIKLLSGSSLGLVVLGAGIGIAGVVWAALKIGRPLQEMRDDVIQIKAQTNGRASMANTVADHERRICLAEQAQQETREDVREIKADVKDIYGMLNSRRLTLPVEVDRREPNRN